MTFAEQIRPLIDKLDGGVSEAARVCEVSRKSIHSWLRSDYIPPLVTREGVIAVLERETAQKRAGGHPRANAG